mgnify:CR=1 FL=1|tara:strand:- start:12782 stop:13363 length:582 start_codon:yes stop_codon:yes gene_type:complete
MIVTKRQLRRIIKEEARRLMEDSIDSELDHLKKNVHDDIEHIRDLKDDIRDDHEEELRAEKARKDESRRRTKSKLRRIVRRTINEEHADWGMGKDEDSRTHHGEKDYTGHKGDHSKTHPGELDYEDDAAGRAHDAIAAIHDLASAAGVELDVTAGDALDSEDATIIAMEGRLRRQALKKRIKRLTRDAIRRGL